MTESSVHADRRDSQRLATGPAHAASGIQARYIEISVLPAAAMAVLGAAAVGYVLAARPTGTAARVMVAAAAVAAALVLLAAYQAARAAFRRVSDEVGVLSSRAAGSQEELRRLAEQVRRGEVAGADSGQRVEVFVNLSRRMQSLVHREIQLLDDLEAQVEDPELLKGLFTVDHLATRMRRQSESLAVLGGAVSRRQWRRPVTMHEVLRAAVAEVEHYSRVKVVPPIDGTLAGGAVADVIHLIAELIENATKFSAPTTGVLLRAQAVTAGLAIEVEDRGLGIVPADRDRINALLADPSGISISELLRDGRIGLFVVSTLARRHGIRVQLQSNIYGGTQAVAVIPKAMTETAPAAAPPKPEPAVVPPAPVSPRIPAPGVTPGQGGQRVPMPAMPAPASAARSLAPAPVPMPPPASQPRQWEAARDAVSVPHEFPADAGGQRGDTGVRSPGAAPRGDSGNRPPEWGAPGQQGGGPLPRTGAVPASRPANPAERPALPRRSVQASLAPELRTPPRGQPEETAVDQLPGLMAAFRGGISRAEEDDGTVST